MRRFTLKAAKDFAEEFAARAATDIDSELIANGRLPLLDEQADLVREQIEAVILATIRTAKEFEDHAGLGTFARQFDAAEAER